MGGNSLACSYNEPGQPRQYSVAMEVTKHHIFKLPMKPACSQKHSSPPTLDSTIASKVLISRIKGEALYLVTSRHAKARVAFFAGRAFSDGDDISSFGTIL